MNNSELSSGVLVRLPVHSVGADHSTEMLDGIRQGPAIAEGDYVRFWVPGGQSRLDG